MSIDPPREWVLFENENFVVEQCDSCPLPGYLIITSKQGVKSFSEFDTQVASQMGQIISGCAAAVEKIIEPENIYVIRLGEVLRVIHFHIFPRTKALTDQYKKQFGDGTISGSQFFEWARSFYSEQKKDPKNLSFVMAQLSKELKALL